MSPWPAGLCDPTAADVHRLQRLMGFPLVSILVSTTPGPDLAASDRLKISGLIADAERRLRLELEPRSARRLADRLRALVIDAVDEPMGAGLAVFVGDAVGEIFRLPHAPVDRVVVDPTFATRDLLLAIYEHPPTRVLVLADSGARLFVVSSEGCEECRTDVFPLYRGSALAQIRDVAGALSVHSLLNEFPLVILGPRPLADRVAGSLAVRPEAIIDATLSDVSADLLAVMTESVLASAVARARAEAMIRFDLAMLDGHALIGIDEVWAAAQVDGIEMLLVDRMFAYSARLDTASQRLVWTPDPTPPGVIDDAVDEIIEMVTASGGKVHFAERGELGDDGIAAIACALKEAA